MKISQSDMIKINATSQSKKIGNLGYYFIYLIFYKFF